MRKLIVAAAIFAAVIAPSQAHAGFLGGVGTYAKDRFHDLLDVVRLRGGVPEDGKGIGAKAKVTSLAQVGYVQFRGKMAGMERRAIGVTAERRSEGGLSLIYASSNEMRPVAGNDFIHADTAWSDIEDRRIIRNLPYWDDGRRRFLGIGAEIATPVLALDAGVYPEEAIDFIVGWVGIDLYDDDELFLNGGDLYEPTTPRIPDSTAPFRAKRAALEAFDERMELEAALSDVPMELERDEAAPMLLELRPITEPTPPKLIAPNPPAPPVAVDMKAKKKSGVGDPPRDRGGNISGTDADAAVRAIETKPATPPK